LSLQVYSEPFDSKGLAQDSANSGPRLPGPLRGSGTSINWPTYCYYGERDE
jgi:hypothetical protein